MLDRNRVSYLTFQDSVVLVETLTEKLRNIATISGWPASVVASLEVKNEGDSLYITYDTSMSSQVDLLEYGDLNSLPNPVLRPFMYRAFEYIENTVGKNLASNMLFGTV